MSLILTLQCDTADCTAMMHGEGAINLIDRSYPLGTSNHDTGDCIVAYGRGLEADLLARAIADGWYWDGSEWTCAACAAGNTPRWRQEQATRSMFGKLLNGNTEPIAHWMNS